MPKKILFFLAAAILTWPLLITPFTLYPYIHGKILATIGVMLIGLAIFLYYRYGGAVPPLKGSPLFTAVAVFLGVTMLVSFFGVNFERSFWGSWPRLLGIFHYLVIFIFAFALGSVFTKNDWQALMKYGLYISALVSVIAIIQKWLPILVWHGYRVGSTLDNPAFLAGYLIFFVFWGAILFIEKPHWPVALATSLSLLALILTRTRGALIGLLVGFLVAEILMMINKDSRKWGLKFIAFTAVGLILILLFDWGAIQRFVAISVNEATVLSRLLIWKISWQGFLAQPLLGWGFENFNAIFNKFYDPLLLKLSYGETFADKAHNFPLELLATTGLAGLLAYLGLFGATIYCLWRLVKRGLMDYREASLISGLLAAYLISLSFLFDQLFTIILFLLTLAYLHQRYIKSEINSRPMRSSIFILGLAVAMTASWLGVIKPAIASIYNHRATSIFTTNPDRGDGYFKKALKWAGPWQADIVAERASAIYTALLADKTNLAVPINLLASSFDELKEMPRRYPHDARFPIFIGYLGNWLGGDYADLAEAALRQALENLNPARQQIRNILVENYLLREKYAEAVAVARETVAQSPNVSDSHYYLGNALLLAGQEIDGFAELSKAEELGYPKLGSKPYEILISQAIEKKNWSKAIELYERAIKVDPENSLLFSQLAAVYSRIGNRLKAIEAVRQAVRLNPALQAEAERFIKTLP